MVILAAVVGLVPSAACAPAPGARSPAYLAADGDGASAGPGAAARAGPRVASPWRPGRPELGVQVYWHDNRTDTAELLRLKVERVVDYVIGLDANAVSVSFPVFTPAVSSSTITAGPETPRPDRLAVLLDEIERAGLRTTLRPLLDEENLIAANPKDWRGSLRPADPDAWFASYREVLTPYLTLAERAGVETVVIGTEFNSLEGDPRWRGFTEHVRSVFRGETAYAFNWDAFAHFPADMPVQRIGVDAYPALKQLRDDASTEQVAAAWHGWLDERATGPMRNVMIYEVGAAAQSGLYQRPSRLPRPGAPLNETLQERWFSASCQVAREREMAGLYWWKVDFHLDPAAADPVRDDLDSFVGRTAEQVVRSCFASWGDAR